MVRHSRDTTTHQACAGYLTAWTKTNFADDVKRIDTPMLVCPGEHDKALTREVMEKTYLAWLPKAAERQVLANAGHYPMQETPVHLATVMERFFARHA